MALVLGKKPAVKDARVPNFSAMLDSVPTKDIVTWQDTDWRGDDIGAAGRILGDNDEIGDCTIVAPANGILIMSGYNGTPQRMSNAECVQNYMPFGYNPNAPLVNGENPTDQGADMMAVAKYWKTNGLVCAGKTNKLTAFATLDPKNLDHLKLAMKIGAGINVGAQLPMIAQRQYSNGRPFAVTGDGQTGIYRPGSWGGHDMWVLAADDYGLWTITWATVWRWMWDAFTSWCDEAFVCLDPLLLNAKGLSPELIGLPQAEAALTRIGVTLG